MRFTRSLLALLLLPALAVAQEPTVRRVLQGENATIVFGPQGGYAPENYLKKFTGTNGADQWATQNGALAERLSIAVREVRGTSQRIGVPFGTNATAYGAHFPTVVFGPGSIAQAHTADEWLALDQLEQASEILYRFLLSLPRSAW